MSFSEAGAQRVPGAISLDAILNIFDGVRRRLEARYVGRREVIRVLQLAVVCREHVLLLGPPGTAKTDLVATFARETGTEPFRSLLTRFTEPAELFGPLDAVKYRDGSYAVQTANMLPQAHLAILDEIFQGSSAILNTLLALIGDRTFHNGPVTDAVPLLSLIGTSNELPLDPGLSAFTDRFLLRLRVEPVAGQQLEELLARGSQIEAQRVAEAVARRRAPYAPREHWSSAFTPEHADVLSEALAQVDTTAVRPVYAMLIKDLLRQGVTLSDRRIVQGLKLIAGAALLDKRRESRPADLWPLAHIWTEPGEDERAVREAVRVVVGADGGDPSFQQRNPRGLIRDAKNVMSHYTSLRQPGEPDFEDAMNQLNDLQQALPPTAQSERAEIEAMLSRLTALFDATFSPLSTDPAGGTDV